MCKGCNKMLPRGGRAFGKGFKAIYEISDGPIYMLDPKYESEEKKKELEELKKVFDRFGIRGGQ